MSAAPRICVIHNPVAGTRGSAAFKAAATGSAVAMTLIATRGPGHAETLAREAVAHFDIVAAAGGDGTVNEVARGLLGGRAALGIVPVGSGNGLARHLGLPLDPSAALDRLASGTRTAIDVGRINGHVFVCTAGIGFDAHVARHFAAAGQRGFRTYLKTALTRYRGYRPTEVETVVNGVMARGPCTLMAFANGSQYGNDAFIAPHADCSDGVLEVCFIDRLPLWRATLVGIALMRGTLPASGHALFHTAHEATVRADAPMEFHVDGDWKGEARDFAIDLLPGALEVVV